MPEPRTDLNLTNQIRELRFHHSRMSQQRLADMVGVSRQTINSIEQNKYNPSLLLAWRIARVFGRSIEEIFGVDEKPVEK